MKFTPEELVEMIKKVIDEKLEALTKIDPKDRPNTDDGEHKDNDQPVWKSLGEQLQAVAKVATRHAMDPRLIFEKLPDGTQEKQLGANEGVGADGGFLVFPEFSKKLLMQTYETGILSKDCWRIPISSNRLIMNAVNEVSRVTGARSGALLTYWLCEAGTKVASKPDFRQIDLKLNKHIGAYYATDELLEDATALESIVSKMFADEFGWRIDDAILNGTGAGMPLGILNGAGLVQQAAEALQVADTVVAANIMGMWNLMPAKNRIKAKWYINQDVEPQLMQMYIEAGLGGVPIWLPPGGLITSPSGTLLGRAIEPIEQASALGDVGDIIFADMSQYVIAERAGGIQAASSIHVQFMTDEQVFRFVLRIDGQPMWNSGVLAADGVTTRSPYVALANRA